MLRIKRLTSKILCQDFLDILAEAFNSTETASLTLADARKLLKIRDGDNVYTFVGKLGGKVVATASIILERKFLHGGGLVGHIEDVCVHADYRGCGYGRNLVDHLVEFAKKKGAYKVVLYCSEHNEEFYNKCGFETSCVLMRRDLK